MSVEQDQQEQQEQKACPECGAIQKVNRDGSLRKHPGSDGETCLQRESADPLAEKPVVDEWPEDGAAQDPNADGDGTDPKPVQPATPPVLALPVEDAGTWRWTMTVKHPALYLSDAQWHQENALMAAKVAADTGHTVTGEAHWDGGIGGGEDEGTVQLTYLVPVEA